MNIQSIQLQYTNHAVNSDKVYFVQIEEVKRPNSVKFIAGNKYVVNFQYGRRGSSLKKGTKTPTPVSLEKAETIYEKLIASKMKKGYWDRQAA